MNFSDKIHVDLISNSIIASLKFWKKMHGYLLSDK